MRLNARRLLALAMLVATAPAAAEEDRDPKAGTFFAAVAGDWEGTLEYRDYSTDRRVKLPTTLESRLAEGGRAASWKFRYDEGKGRFVEGLNTLRVDSGKNTLAWESDGGKVPVEYALTGLDSFAGKGRRELVLTGLGTEAGVEVEVRQTITRDGDDLTILRESRKPGADFAFRNSYTLRRKPAPPAPTTPRP